MGGGDRVDALASSTLASVPTVAPAAETTPPTQSAPIDDGKKVEGDYVWVEKDDSKGASPADRVTSGASDKPATSDSKSSSDGKTSSTSNKCATDCCAWFSCASSQWCEYMGNRSICGGGSCRILLKVLAFFLVVKILMCCKLLLFICGGLAVGCWYSCCRTSCGASASGTSKCPFSGLTGLGGLCPMSSSSCSSGSSSSSSSSSQSSLSESKKDR